MNQESEGETFYVLRLLIVKLEGVLLPPPTQWNEVTDSINLTPFNPDQLFPDWCSSTNLAEQELRNRLESLAKKGDLPLDENIRSLLDEVHNHTPMRVALLSGGPSEWTETLIDSYELSDRIDLSFCYDNYKHGTRRTLLQFLMNRFIAGKGRTLLLGNTQDDERIAKKEETRFRSLQEPPPDAQNPENWDWTLSELTNFIDKVKAED